MHDKGYYHSYIEEVLMAHTPPQSGLALLIQGDF